MRTKRMFERRSNAWKIKNNHCVLGLSDARSCSDITNYRGSTVKYFVQIVHTAICRSWYTSMTTFTKSINLTT